MDDAINNLEHAHQELENYDDVRGDPKCLETHMKKLQVGFYYMYNQNSENAIFGGENLGLCHQHV